MKQQFIPLEKQSKRSQQEYYAAKRGSWGGINPVTRKPPNPKAYNRKKSGRQFVSEPLPDFIFSYVLFHLELFDGLLKSHFRQSQHHFDVFKVKLASATLIHIVLYLPLQPVEHVV